jgi:thioesterase domain-containing protein
MTAGAALVADVADYVESLPAPVNELALQRIRRARDRATDRLTHDRDTAAWNAEMKRLDAEEAEVKASADRGPTRADVAADLADLARLYDSAMPETRQRIAHALFARVEVLGPTKVWLHPSEEAAAQGWATAMSGEFTAQIRRNGRGERI